MSQYTTGEMAKLCGVSVRTVQYYDSRGLLVPSALSEGGRRLYSDEDLKRLRTICFLKETDMPLNSISRILSEENADRVISLLLEQQEQSLQDEIGRKKNQLQQLKTLRNQLKNVSDVSVDSIQDIAQMMSSKEELKKIRRTVFFISIPLGILQWTGILLWVLKGIWQPFVLWLILSIPWGIGIVRYYHKHVAYICPQCHTRFQPSVKEFFWAGHTPNTRKLVCPHCKEKSYCVETAMK
ncbi:MAG: MerR family transcriptional regulator [Erysipelotrichaceae bacterium]|nr:MerR family transcriptional regulator [Erysipelotrichaceae bacterium]